jgi:hypothetical protein
MALPICDTASLQAVTLVDPPMWGTVASLTPNLHWTYPDPACSPEGYAISLHTGPLFTDELGGGTGNPSTSWSPGAALEPGKEYSWGVSPINGSSMGPFAGSNYFFTGPTCATAALVAPTLLQPADGGTFNEGFDSLIWDYPEDCAPQGYRIDLSVDPTFADTSLSGGTGNPSTRWGPGGPLSDCQTYYWRVAAINDITLGPFSPSRSFVRDAGGECGPGGSPPASAAISGIVWNDLCALPDGPLPSPLPEGCVDNGAGGVRADGIRQPGELGIAGVRVDLHWGGCATPRVADVLTDASGHYQFDGLLVFGSYCLAIRIAEAPNNAILIPGAWTYPAGLLSDAFANATVDSGTILNDKDFGWDYQLDGPPATSAVAGIPVFILNKNAFCRKGPGQVYSDVTAIPIGETVEILGRSQDSQWYFILWKKFNAKCWIGLSTGHTSGDLAGIVVMIAPPTPTWTPVPATKPSATPTHSTKKP